MIKIALKKTKNPYNTPLAPLIAQAVAELAQTYDQDECHNQPDWNCDVFYAEVDGKIVGLLCWKTSEWMLEAQIALGYVLPQYRGLGVYSQLFAALEEEAIRLKLRSISGYTSVDNKTLQAIAVKQGRELVSLGYRKRLPFEGETVSSVPIKTPLSVHEQEAWENGQPDPNSEHLQNNTTNSSEQLAANSD